MNPLDYTKKTAEILSTPLLTVGGNKLSLSSIIVGLLVVWATFRVAKLVEKIIRTQLKDRDLDQGVKQSFERIGRYIVLVMGMFLALDTIGISLSSLAAVGAVLMVGVGFGLQNITQNFISGLILLLERPIKVGDFVIVGNESGKVVDIRARSTLIHTRDGIDMLVPNSEFISSTVVNHSFTSLNIRYKVKVGVAYGSDVNKVKDILLEVAKGHDKVLTSPVPQVLFMDFGDSALMFELWLWSKDAWQVEVILSEIRFEIDKRFREENVKIPFPQRDVYLFPQN